MKKPTLQNLGELDLVMPGDKIVIKTTFGPISTSINEHYEICLPDGTSTPYPSNALKSLTGIKGNGWSNWFLQTEDELVVLNDLRLIYKALKNVGRRLKDL